MSDEYQKQNLKPADAAAFIRKAKGKSLFISVGQSAPVDGKDGYVFPVIANVLVTRKLALKFLADAYSQTMADKGALVSVATLGNCVFIGSAA